MVLPSFQSHLTLIFVKFNMMQLVAVLLFFPLFTSLHAELFDYHWRDYSFQDIPDDAYASGSDRNQKTTYIGQVYIPNQGLLIGTIQTGEKSVTVSKSGVHSSDLFVKILCSESPQKLAWLSTTAIKFQNDTASKHLVIGGTENGKTLNIGRLSYQGEVVVGKVCGYNPGYALLYFAHRGEEIPAASYEVLIYENVY